ncbi:MAG: type II secretion system F family protein [Candidatus Eutrophobiaceae bacterium]
MSKLTAKQRIIGTLFFGHNARSLFYRRLQAFAEENIPIMHALNGMHERWAERCAPIQEVSRHCLQSLRRGHSLSTALSPWLPTHERILLEAAVHAGNLSDGLAKASDLCVHSGTLMANLRSALAYPIFLLCALASMVAWFCVAMVPSFSAVIPPEQWQGHARNMYTLSQFITAYGLWLPPLALSPILAFALSLSSWRGDLRARLDRYPPYSLYRLYQSAVFLLSISSMTRSGVPIYDALSRIQMQADPWLGEKISRMQMQLRTGMSPGQAFDSPLFDNETRDDLHVYAAHGDLNNSLDAISHRIVTNVLLRMQNASRILNYLLLIMAGTLIAWSISALYSLPDGLHAQGGI